MRFPEDGPLTLAELRRKRGGASTRKLPTGTVMPGLFDVLPDADLPANLAADFTRAPDEKEAVPVQKQPASEVQERAVPVLYTAMVRPGGEAGPAAAVVPTPTSAVWTVSGLVQQVRAMVEGTYRAVSVEGEISNWRPANSGHCYFTLKDGSAQLSAVLFRKQAALLRFRPKDGDTVRLRGQLSVYESRGQMQLIGESMEQVGLGALLAATRELKERLRREGLFDRKRPLPAFPRCIGIVTSVQGAALRDIVKVCRRRHAAVNLLVYPVVVQGPLCAPQVAGALRWFGLHADRVDVVLVARGGGSWEDLHGFDDERVARAIVACSLPVISGIGHAVDSTIADAAADVCAPTPSAAAELLTAAQHRVEEQVSRLAARLERAGRFEVLRAKQRISSLGTERLLRRVEMALGRRAQHADELGLRLREAQQKQMNRKAVQLLHFDSRLRYRSPALRLSSLRERTGQASRHLRRAAEELTKTRRQRLDHALGRLEALSPLRVLERGYALVYGPEGQLLRAADDVRSGEKIVARLARGRLSARVEANG